METVIRRKRKWNKRKWNRRKRILIAYAARTAAVLVVSMLLGLIICGFLFIAEHLFKEQVVYGEVMEEMADDSIPAWQTSDENMDGRSVEGKVILLDAGHGGKDEGTSYGNIKEKDIVLAMTSELKKKLEAQGAVVIMTREDDSFLSLEERAGLANSEDVDLYISIHADWFEEDTSIHGLTCHYMPGSVSGQQYASKLSEIIEETGVVAVRQEMASDFYVLRNTQMPAVLIETGFLSNSIDRNNLSNQDFQKKLAEAIAQGICKLWA